MREALRRARRLHLMRNGPAASGLCACLPHRQTHTILRLSKLGQPTSHCLVGEWVLHLWLALPKDLFCQKCLDFAGVSHTGDWHLVTDGNCHGPGRPPSQCAPGKSAYHPLKSASVWTKCWRLAGPRRLGWARCVRAAPRDVSGGWGAGRCAGGRPRLQCSLARCYKRGQRRASEGGRLPVVWSGVARR